MLNHLLLVGCGKMGGAMLESWCGQNIANHFFVLEPGNLPAPLQNKANITHAKNTNDLKLLDKKFDVIILAVKPQIMDEIAPPLKEFTAAETLILSIAAGRTLADYESYFGAGQPIIRAMPNTPAAIGKGAITAVPNAPAQNRKQTAQKLLETTGDLHWIDDESLMNAITALSGSGPAYLFYLIEILTRAGHEIGLPEDLAQSLARQTVIGAAALAEQDNKTSAAQLRQNVTSPGGTTEAALEILMHGEIQEIFTKALNAAKTRGEELSS